MPRQKPYHKDLRIITTTSFAKTKTLPQIPANYHHHGFCQDKKPYQKHLRTITTTYFGKTKTLPQAPANYHRHGFCQDKKTLPQALANYDSNGFCQDKNLTTSIFEPSPPRVLPRHKPYHKHLRTITTTGFAKTKTLPQAPANYHRHGFCQDKNLTTSTCDLSPPRVLPRQKPYHKHLRTITTTGFAKTKPYHKHLRTITATRFAKTKTLPQAPANYHHHGFCQDKNLTTSTCELSPPRVLPRQKPYHKHLRTITTTGFAKTKTLPQAPANYHHHGFCQDKNLTTSTCELSPPRVLPRQKPYHKHLRTITTTGFAKTKNKPQAPANYHHHGFSQDKNLTTSTCELSPPRFLPRQKPYHKHLRTITTTGFAKTKTLPQAPANYHHHGFCQDKNLTTSTCELSPPRVLPRQKPYHKHLRTITTAGFAKTKTLPQAPANYHHHGFCQDKNLTTSTCELSPPRNLPRQKPYHKHLRTITTTGFAKTKTLPQTPANYHRHGFCQDTNFNISTCELSPPRVLPRHKPDHKHLRTITTTGFAKTKILPQAPANYHHHGFCQDKNLTTSTCELSPPRVLPRQKPDHKHLRTITTTGFAKTKTLPQAPASYRHHGFCQDKNLTTSTCELSPPRVLPRQQSYHKHLRTITTTGFAKTKILPQAPANYHHHGFCQDKNLTTSTCELSPPWVSPRQKPFHKHLRTITTTGFDKTRQATAYCHHDGFCQDTNLTTSTCEL